jgi:hypothetical protein
MLLNEVVVVVPGRRLLIKGGLIEFFFLDFQILL